MNSPETIDIVAVNFKDEDLTTYLAGAIREVYGIESRVGRIKHDLLYSYHADRSQFNATQILNRTVGLSPADTALFIVDVDLYVEKLNFVFGLADMNRRRAIISLTRLRPEIYGLAPDRGLFLKRTAKEAVHELGHLLGLAHCPEPSCVMHFSNRLEDTDLKESFPCAVCRGSIEEKQQVAHR